MTPRCLVWVPDGWCTFHGNREPGRETSSGGRCHILPRTLDVDAMGHPSEDACLVVKLKECASQGEI